MATMKQKVRKVRVTFKLHPEFLLDDKYTEIYLVGNTAELGEWNPENALIAKRRKNGSFSRTKFFPVGTEIEFKCLLAKSYAKVEQNQYFCDIQNRKVVCNEGQTIDFIIENFKL